jgi:SNF2 family DNA or RNA helicase
MLKTRLISPYQHDGVKWLLARELSKEHPGGFLCDEMGLGKTVQLIATCLANPKPRTLVITPKSIMGQWASELARFAPSLNVVPFNGPPTFDMTKCNVVIAPYSMIAGRTLVKGAPIPKGPLHKFKWDRIILDEGHEIRNQKSKMHQGVKMLNADIRWVVTGTPVFNSIKDFIALCSFVGIDQRSVQAHAASIRARFVMRRTKADVCEFNARLALPPCDFENVELTMYDEEAALYRHVYETSRESVRKLLESAAAAGFKTMAVLEALLRIRQCMIWPQLYHDGVARKNKEAPEVYTGRSKKMEYLVDSILEHPREKSLIFGQFIGEMNLIQSLLEAKGMRIFRIDGSVAKDARDDAITGFKAAAPGAVFLIQIKAGGVGLNLQEATRVYITSPAWNPATELQAIGRSHRTGQVYKVWVKKLMYEGEDDMPSVEQSIMQLQGHKALVCAEVLQDQRLLAQVPTEPKNPKASIQAFKHIFNLNV